MAYGIIGYGDSMRAGGVTYTMNTTIEKEKKTTHNVGWCYRCGWTHSRVTAINVVEGDTIVIKPICSKCRHSLKSAIICPLCGNSTDELCPVTITKRRFVDASTCNVILYMCKKCRERPHKDVLDKLTEKLSKVCDSCEDKFKCFTSAYSDGDDSVAGADKIHRSSRAALRSRGHRYGRK